MPFAHDSLAAAAMQSFLAGGVGTALGAVPILFLRRIAPRVESALSGFSAGVMLAAAFVALLLPALELARAGSVHSFTASIPIALGVALGTAFVAWLHGALPHEHFAKGREGADSARLRRVWLFALALALHNVPEGLAVGVGVASGDEHVSLPVTLGIAVQNVPEGLIVALAFVAAGYTKREALLVTAATGIVEPVAACFGWTALQFVSAAMPAALSFAAGAMIYVVSHEIIPESHREERSVVATWGLVLGVLLMVLVDAAL